MNTSPVFTAVGAKTVAEASTLTFALVATDAEGNALTYSCSAGCPAGLTVSSAGVVSWTPSYAQAGTYGSVTYRVTDGLSSSTTSHLITVSNVNRAPVLTEIANQVVAEGSTLLVRLDAIDADGDPLTYGCLASCPSGLTVNGNSLAWTPTYSQAGQYSPVFFVTDGTHSDSVSPTFLTMDTNTTPTLADPGTKSVFLGETLSFNLTGNDLDGDALTYSCLSGCSAGMEVTTSGAVSWIPTESQSGTHSNVTFRVLDGSSNAATRAISIDVLVPNRAPTLAFPGNFSVQENNVLSFVLLGTDLDGTPLTFSCIAQCPAGLTVAATTGVVNWIPSFVQAGTYAAVTFAVSDGSASSSQAITINVLDVNQAPLLASVPNKSVNERETLAFTLSGSDPDGDNLSYSCIMQCPAGLVVNGVTGLVSWTPLHSQSGNYSGIIFQVSDGKRFATQATAITVFDKPGTPSALKMTGPTLITSSVCSSEFLVTLRDADGNRTTPSSSTVVTLSGNGSGYFYSDVNCVTDVSTITLDALAGPARVYFKTNAPGSFTFRAQAESWTDGVLSVSARAVVGIAMGQYHSCALLGATLNCWGKNSTAQVGNASYANAYLPMRVRGLPAPASSVAAGYGHTCAISNGGVSCWGDNAYGQLGIGSLTHSSAPVSIGSLSSNVIELSSGTYHTCARKSDGSLWCWGRNQYGQLGDNSTVDRNSPVQILASGSQTELVTTGYNHTCAVVGGAAKCWGYNNRGQLGNSSTINSSSPIQVTGLTSGVVKISTGTSHTCALSSGGSVTCWGYNLYGQVGDNTSTQKTIPTQVDGLTGGVSSIAAGSSHTCATLTAGGLKCWGRNSYGQIGNNSTTKASIPVLVSGIATTTVVSEVSAGFHHTCGVLGGALRCWGLNNNGQLGSSAVPTGYRKIAAPVNGLSSGVSFGKGGADHFCAVVSGAVQCWGYNSSGQLGIGNLTSQSAPTAIPSLTTGVISLAAGESHGCALSTGGNLNCWGANVSGQVGDGTTTDRSSPVAVSGFGVGSGASALSSGSSHTCAVKQGAAYCWGKGLNGRLGHGGIANSTVPAAVTGLGSGVTALAAGGDHTCAVVSGAAMCWGRNERGQLGNGTTLDSTSPVQVSGLTSEVADISAGTSHSCALLNNGAVKCWGRNNNKQLGDRTISQRETPVFVSGVSNATKLTSGNSHNCVVAGGGVNCWGRNDYGQLGNDASSKSGVAVVAAGMTSDIYDVAAGDDFTCATKVSGELNCWGSNAWGQLGHEPAMAKSPVSVAVFQSSDSLDVLDENGDWLATFTVNSFTVSSKGPLRIFSGDSATHSVSHQIWVRTLPEAFQGTIDTAWLSQALADNANGVADVLATSMQYIQDAPPVYDSAGLQIAGNASYGPLQPDGTRIEGSDFYDYLGMNWSFSSSAQFAAESAKSKSLDCSGFIRMAWGYRSGLPLSPYAFADNSAIPRTSIEIYESGPGSIIAENAGTQLVDFSKIMVGDIVFFDASTDNGTAIDHVGIYLGTDSGGYRRFISSRKSRDGPTFGDYGGWSVLNRATSLYTQSFRAIRRL